jgi:hypothetical protein
MKLLLFAAIAVLGGGSTTQPACGVWKYPIEPGVLLNMPMGDAAPSFSLEFTVANTEQEGLRLRKPFGLTTYAVDNPASLTDPSIPWVYLTELYLTDGSGERVYIGSVTLTCGTAATLSQTVSRKLQDNALDEQRRGVIVSFPNTAEQRTCFKGLQTDNRISLKLVTDETAPRTLTVDASLPVAAMIAASRRLYGQEMARSKTGECWIASYPPFR